MQELLQRREDIDCIVIETSGLALPKPLVQAFRWPEIRTGATVDGVVTVVDGDALAKGHIVGDLEALEAQRQADDSLDHETPIEELFEDQLACADMVLLTKTDLMEIQERERVQTWLQSQATTGIKIVPCHQGEIQSEVLLGFNDDDIISVCIELEQSFDPKGLVQRLQALVQEQDIYRIKGFVVVPNKAMRLVLQGVGQRFDTFYDRPWQANEPRRTRLVFIGHNLDQTHIRQQITIKEESAERVVSSGG